MRSMKAAPAGLPIAVAARLSLVGGVLMILAGCTDTGAVKLLYGNLVSRDGGTTAIIVVDQRIGAPNAQLVVFEPPPRGSYSVVQGQGSALEVQFTDPEPFPDEAVVTVRLRSGAGGTCKLSRGLDNPVLTSATWRDCNADRVVDQGDLLDLHFSGPVVVGDATIDPKLEFFLSEGIDQLGTLETSKDGCFLERSADDPTTLTLKLGAGAYFRPGRAGEPPASLLGINATYAAPSRLIRAADSGRGAVLFAPGQKPAGVPICSEEGFEAFRLIGDVDLGPEGGNNRSTVTFCQGNGHCLVVFAGGENPAEPSEAAGDVFVLDIGNQGSSADAAPQGETVSLVWEDLLQHSRYGHTAVALPVPRGSPLWGAVLFLCGEQGFRNPVIQAELLLIEGKFNTRLEQVVLSHRGVGQPLGGTPEPRVDAQAVYVPLADGDGYVVITGGERDVEGSVELLRVTWPDRRATASLPMIEHQGPFGRSGKDFPSRTDHTLTAIELPGGEPAVLLYGGRVGRVSVAMPFVIRPARARESTRPEEFIEPCGRVGMDPPYARHGHKAVYLPERRRVVIMGGYYERSREKTAIPLDAVVEFDPAARHPVKDFTPRLQHQFKIDPELILLPESERILVVGGRDYGEQRYRTVDVYEHPGPRAGGSSDHARSGARSVPHFSAFGSFVPEEATNCRGAFLTCGASIERGKVYLAGTKGTSVWALDLR